MRRDEFVYDLPPELIAQFPTEHRGDSRLLCLDGLTGRLEDRQFATLPELLKPGDLLVFNDTRVIPARLYGEKETGGKVEIMVERVLDDQHILAQLRASKTPKLGSLIHLDKGITLKLECRQDDMFVLVFNNEYKVDQVLQMIGHMPLPPYIQRPDQVVDRERYQTIFARQPGAVAAPTAGLHFTSEMFELFEGKGIEITYITLHVGAGTFQPVRAEHIKDHKMHRECLMVKEEVCEKIAKAKTNGGRIIAVGTTSVRCLETAARSGTIQPYSGETDIFIYPGFEFQLVDVLITNFHLPESTLLMLVCAFAGKEQILTAYQHAISEKYRFYSYGDAMYITAKQS
jgi:S-adenosylmethionine:tRNA ribosyltransferase-isomerase